MKRLQIFSLNTILTIFIFGASGCFTFSPPSEDTSFLEPIPEATLQAFHFNQPIQSRLLAVIAARRGVEKTTLNDSLNLQVVSVEEMRYKTAISRLGGNFSQSATMVSNNPKVWLVIFLVENIPPTLTPIPSPQAIQSCTFIILDEQNGYPILQDSDLDCRSLYEW